MRFQFSFKHMETSQALQTYAESKILEKIKMFATKPVDAHITFEVSKRDHKMHCHFNGGDGFATEVESTTDDMYKSVDMLIDKLETKLKRQKEKIKDHKGHFNLRHINEKGGRWSETKEDAIDASDILKYEEARKRRASGH